MGSFDVTGKLPKEPTVRWTSVEQRVAAWGWLQNCMPRAVSAPAGKERAKPKCKKAIFKRQARTELIPEPSPGDEPTATSRRCACSLFNKRRAQRFGKFLAVAGVLALVGATFMGPERTVSMLAEEFAVADTDGSGYLEVREFQRLLRRTWGSSVTVKEVEAAVLQVDSDGGMRVDFWEFFDAKTVSDVPA